MVTPRTLTRDVFDQLCDGGVVGQRAPGSLHVRQLRHELLDLPHRLGVVPLLQRVEPWGGGAL